jgi:hypothetical protein
VRVLRDLQPRLVQQRTRLPHVALQHAHTAISMRRANWRNRHTATNVVTPYTYGAAARRGASGSCVRKLSIGLQS